MINFGSLAYNPPGYSLGKFMHLLIAFLLISEVFSSKEASSKTLNFNLV